MPEPEDAQHGATRPCLSILSFPSRVNTTKPPFSPGLVGSGGKVQRVCEGERDRCVRSIRERPTCQARLSPRVCGCP